MFLYRDYETLVETAQIIECWVKDIGVAAIFGANWDNSLGDANEQNVLTLQIVVHLEDQCWEGKMGVTANEETLGTR